MRAAWFEKFGPAADFLVVGEQPTPEPQQGEALVRLMTSGVNPSDVKKRAGAFPNLLDDGLVIPIMTVPALSRLSVRALTIVRSGKECGSIRRNSAVDLGRRLNL